METAVRDEAAYAALKKCRPRSWGSLRTMAAVDSYVGETRQVDSASYPVLEGLGTLYSRMGYEFTGLMHEGEPSGTGVQRWSDGRTVCGPFQHGTVTGSGSLHWPNGDVYTGDLCESVRHGRGTLVSDAGKSRYTGDWHSGMRHGHGTQAYPDGSVYEGEWQRNARHGNGCLRYSTGDIYEGAWSEDTPCGNGVMGWVDRSGCVYRELYKGEWKAGCPHGNGVSTYVTMPKSFLLEPSPTPLVVPSQYTAPAEALLNVYVGAYRHGQRHGSGTFYYADGSCYEGGWAAGAKRGAGHFTSAVGEVQAMDTASKQDAEAAEEALTVLTMEESPLSVVPSVSPHGLGSLLETEDDLQVTMPLLLLLYNTQLKTLFKDYGRRSAHVALPTTRSDWWQRRLPGRMTLTQCLCLLHDAHILGSRFSIGSALRAVAEVLRVEAATWRGARATTTLEAALSAVNEADGTLNYRQFCEWLIRVAVGVNGGPTLTTVKAKVSALLDGPLSRVHGVSSRAVAVTFLPNSLQHREDVQRHLSSLKRCYAELQSVKDGDRYGVSLRSCLTAMERTLATYQMSPACVLEKLAWLKEEPELRHSTASNAKTGAEEPSLAQEMVASATAKNRQVQLLDEDAGTEQSFVEFVETVMTIVEVARHSGFTNADTLLVDLQRRLFAQ
ncbi:conserved hypothetical protein [Leishmania braziliensis MHOM/BR/75/M2904]|uniref:Uncharacterized protein n=2 Tax=Leishmania braziliensis TaxID=5660 RepID=A4H9U9_LEIBR|nr:conserved hypothetical protein [Leishmania braziliensis MHOM/BR/75/M2904]CAJ2468262.1 unnamed protein product [Leishmania braziliensis]CAM38175.1 conserved hypothetical protein [Leishmania braziliensis MHOM/BR/75/M2904]